MLYALLFFVLLLVDQLTKALAYATEVSHLAIIPGYFEIDMLRNPATDNLNTGMSFGIAGDEPWAIPVFIAITCVALVVFLIVVMKLPSKKRFLRVSIVFIMAGAAGNLIDRVALGGVRDFIYMNFGFTSFWNNVADLAITAGAVMFILALLFVDDDALFRFGKNKREKQAVAEAAASLPEGQEAVGSDVGEGEQPSHKKE
ncbi:MAG TPA: signal peptidase II [Candidatus Borkfalkia stercoripullorum]|nr:signal peptidase II [Candidatus Borkfalkia stercoripullorum]